MEWLLIFLCALVIIALYLQFMGKLDGSSKNSRKNPKVKSKLKLTGSFEGLKQKICPLCNSELGKNDTLFAEMHEGEGRPKVVINGCKYCHIPKK